jgi:hypothetical protein
MSTFLQIVDRSENYASVFFRDRPGIRGYRIRVAKTLDEAYGPLNGVGAVGTTAILDVPAPGGFFRSRSIRGRGWGILDEATRGQTRAMFDLDEHRIGFEATVPPDRDVAFARVQVATDATGGFPLGFPGGAFPGTLASQGPIVVLQNPGWFSTPRPAVSLSGTAPNIATAVAGGIPPADSMHFRVPAYGDSLVFINHSTTDPIFLSMGPGIPFMQIDPSSQFSHTSGQKDSLLIAANGANPTFSALISTVAGAR